MLMQKLGLALLMDAKLHGQDLAEILPNARKSDAYEATAAAHRHRMRNFAEILPRFCRERAENPPRTRREPAV